MSSIGGIKGGGGGKKAGGAGGAKGAGGAGAVRKGGGATFGKIDRVERNEGVSGAVGGSGVQGAEPVLTARALAIAQGLRAGEIKSRQEATQRFVADILKEKLKLANKTLNEKIAESLHDDPRLNQVLDHVTAQRIAADHLFHLDAPHQRSLPHRYLRRLHYEALLSQERTAVMREAMAQYMPSLARASEVQFG